MYREDAVLEFPQSGERFEGVENFREWRSNYPANTRFEFREVRGDGDVWVAELTVRYDEGPRNYGVSVLESVTARSRASRSTSPRSSTRRSGGLGGGPRPEHRPHRAPSAGEDAEIAPMTPGCSSPARASSPPPPRRRLTRPRRG